MSVHHVSDSPALPWLLITAALGSLVGAAALCLWGVLAMVPA